MEQKNAFLKSALRLGCKSGVSAGGTSSPQQITPPSTFYNISQVEPVSAGSSRLKSLMLPLSTTAVCQNTHNSLENMMKNTGEFMNIYMALGLESFGDTNKLRAPLYSSADISASLGCI